MYILQNALQNIGRNRGRNILIGLVMLAIIATTVICLVITNTAEAIINDYKTRFGAEVFLSPDIARLNAEGRRMGRDSLKDIDRDVYRSKNIGVIFQSFNLITNATAVANVVLSMNISGVAIRNKKEHTYGLLAKVGIDKETADRKILKLSGGEQQRVAIARALSHNPDIIIADEPTGNLDAETEDDVLKILSLLAKEEGKCVIIVTHSKKVSGIADEVWGMKDGSITLVK